MIEDLAKSVISAYNPSMGPVNLESIAVQEGIQLAPGDYGESFCGRIEFIKSYKKFFLYYPAPSTNRLLPRTRFSIAHELGHYFIESHRKMLISGEFHNSESGFICEKEKEREADYFASILLMPTPVIKRNLNNEGFLTLRRILQLAREYETSATCAAIRYTTYSSEPCAVVLSKESKVLCYVPSADAKVLGFEWMGKKTIPSGSSIEDAISTIGSDEIHKLETSSENWFSPRTRKMKIWEESFPLGYTNLVLTFLAFEEF